MTRAITDPEKVKYRSDNQSAHRMLAFPQPSTVYTARLSALPTSNDEVSQITYTGGSGTLANVLTDMTLLVSAIGYGLADLGVTRIRKAPTSSIFYLNEMSEVKWAANAYLTIMDDVGVWPRHIITSGSAVLMDVDVAYSDQHVNYDPVPVFGPDLALRLGADGTVSHVRDASPSWVIGSTITGYAFSAPGASATSGLTTSTPTLTYNTPGWYRETLTLIAANGKVTVGHRYVYIWNDSNLPTVEFKLDNCAGDRQSGGYSFQATLWDASIIAAIRKLTPVILFSRDWYGNVEGSIGPLPGAEPVAAIGWITGATVNWQPEQLPSEVQIDVQGPQWWLKKMSAFPTGVRDIASTPSKWTKIENLTPRKGYFHFLHWRTTATVRLDVYPCENDLPMPEFSAPAQSIWSQITDSLDKAIFARPCCNRYGQLFAQVNQNLVPVADRTTIPVVMTIEKQDWLNKSIVFTVREVPEVGYVDFSGISWDHAAQKSTPLFVIAPGHVMKRYGVADPRDRYLLQSQAQANALGGLYLGWRNNPLPQITIPEAANDRLVDIAPYQYVVVAIDASDPPAAAFTLGPSVRVVPTAIKYLYDQKAETWFTTIDGEGETFPDLSITGDTPPTVPPSGPPPPPPPTGIGPLPGLPANAKEYWAIFDGLTTPLQIVWSKDFFTAVDPSYHSLALPANYELPSSAFSFNNALQGCLDGSNLYVGGQDAGNAHARTLWQLDNLAAVRAAPATAPSWSIIAYSGQVIGPGTLYLPSGTGWLNKAVGGKLYVMLHTVGSYHFYSVYDGAAWGYTALGAVYPYLSIFRGAILNADAVDPNWLDNPARIHIGLTWAHAFGLATGYDIFGPYNTFSNYWVVYPKTDGLIYIRHVNSNAEFNTGETVSVEAFTLGGAHGGVECCVHSNAGNLWISTSGAGFTLFETFSTGSGGRVWDARLSGNGPLVRTQRVTPVSNVPISINPTRLPGAWRPMTGDLATVLGWAGNDLTCYGCHLVFRP